MGVKRTLVALVVAGALAVVASAGLRAQAAAVTYKLGTFEQGGRTFLGLVLRDTQIADIARANAAYEQANASAPKLTAPTDMKQLIARYDNEWRARLTAIARTIPATGAPAYVVAVSAVKILPPVRPTVQLNAGGNYVEHEQGIATNQARGAGAARGGAAPAAGGAAGGGRGPAPAAVSVPGIWERKPGDTRDNPYLFLKAPNVIIGANDPIVIPRGRVQIDFECELATVISKPAHYVAVDKAADYIFGYTAHHDVSDRGGRGDRKMGGSDWYVQKNHDTFGPLGPFIVPKEFIKDPMNTRHTMYLNGMVMQDSNTRNMSHNIYELLAFGSSILTLNAGDVISGGSPAGTNIERADPRWMRAGDTAKCDIEGIGALNNPVVAETTTSTR
ncbi:MAG TPA: fumarylacetoacetate hydrolase family protein [Vicinamibacterales bacterium]|nr:fumarylacetoacetate hydrolase family protein [Vicinamibacterales bacterium]